MPLAASILGLTYLLIALQRLPRVRVRSPAGALLGAIMMVASGVLPVDQALLGIPFDLLFFLTGMLIISVYLQAGNTIGFFAEKALRLANTPIKLLMFFLIAGAIVSAVSLNLTAALLLTPLVITTCRRVGESSGPYLIALILGTNLGSAASAIGSPQTMLVVSISGMGFWEYTSKMAVISAIGVVLAGLWLILHYRRSFSGRSFGHTIHIVSSYHLNFTGMSALIVSIAVVIALILGAPMPLAAMTGAAILLAINPQPPKDVLSAMNWPLIIFVGALFVIVGGIAYTGLAGWATSTILPALEHNTTAQVAGLVGLLTALTSLFSNIPSAALISPIVANIEQPDILWFAVALATSFAGNFTLFGSLSNLMVVEILEGKSLRIGYVEFLKTGLPVSLITLIVGIFFLARG